MTSELRADASSSIDMDAAALACVTVSGISLGSWKAPATNTPGLEVDKRTEAVGGAETVFIQVDADAPGSWSLAADPGSMPTDSTTRSKSASASLPDSS